MYRFVISRTYLKLLLWLANKEDFSQNEVADYTSFSWTHTHNVLMQFKGEGIIEESKKNKFKLTEKGKLITKILEQLAKAIERGVIDEINQDRKKNTKEGAKR